MMITDELRSALSKYLIEYYVEPTESTSDYDLDFSSIKGSYTELPTTDGTTLEQLVKHDIYFFCLIPHFIVLFSTKGKYISTLKPRVFSAFRANGHWTEQIPHTTWTYTRVDGGPDRRYRHNPQRTYYTSVSHTDSDALGIRLANIKGKYDIRKAERKDYVGILNAYSNEVSPVLQYNTGLDRVIKVVKLLKICVPDDQCIAEIEDIVELAD